MTGRTRLTCVLGLNQLFTWGTTFYLPAVIAAAAGRSLGASPAAILGGFSWSLIVSGLCSPRMGRWIERRGGRGVLAASTIVIAAGLALLAAAPGLPLWYLGWTLLGFGMALGLYDAAFATVGRLLGSEAGPVITGITLFAGFASSVFWSTGAALAGPLGWRGVLLVYAALHLAVNLPMILLGVPAAAAAAPAAAAPKAASSAAVRWKAVSCLAGFFTLRWLITSAIAVYVLQLFQELGLSAGSATLAAALIGPGQVLGRILEWLFSSRLTELGRARIGAALLPLGVAVLAAGGPLATCAFALLYGMSNGILTINRGTLPLVLFGPAGYAALIGWLAVPVLLAQAAAPILAAPVVSSLSAFAVFLLAAAVALVALGLLSLLRVNRAYGAS